MERKNYNNHGGRSSRGGFHDGGRGNNGRGGGRGRGVGQQGQRSSGYPGQNAGRVDGGNGGRSWSRVASGQPVGAPAGGHGGMQNQNRNDAEMLQVPNIGSLSVSESPNQEVSNTYLPITRPDRGTIAPRTVSLLVNHFPVKFNPSNSILRYDIDVKQEAAAERVLKKPIGKSSLRMIQEKLCSEYPNQFPLLQIAYDGEKNIFSAIILQPGTYKVRVSGKSYVCTIKFGNELNVSKLQDFINGNATLLPRDVLQALDVVTKAHFFREKVSVGKGMYPRVYRTEDDLRCGIAAYRGSQQSLKVTENGLVMCTDYSVVPFRKRMPIIDFIKEHVEEIRSVDDIPRFKNKVVAALRGLKVSVTHRIGNPKYTVSGLSEKLTKDISFEMEDPEGKKKPEVVMLTDYFRNKWDKEIVHTRIPCLQLGKRDNLVPMELCVVADDRRFPKEQLSRDAGRKLKDLSLLPPDYRRSEICRMVREDYAPGHHGAEAIKNFGVEVGMNMTEVVGRVLEPPRLKLGSPSGQPIIITVDRQKCQYNLLQGRTLVAGKKVDRWALIDFTSRHRFRIDVRDFIPKLMKRCGTIGVQMAGPLMVYPTNMNPLSNANSVCGFFEWIVNECKKKDEGRLQLVVCVMPEVHYGYKYIKWASEVKLGVMTQCCLAANVNKGNDQFLANLGLKINAKLDGMNMELVERLPHFGSNDRYMFIGADVNHPAAGNTSAASIAAVVGSVNWPAATRYAARVSPQEHRKEEIINFGQSCLDLVKTYAQFNGTRPNKIIVFRDGVSEGQFDMVMNKEMADMKQVFNAEHYNPLVTYVVAQKRHTTRLFLNNARDNVPPGTVVDTNIVHPTIFDFYLVSHFGGIGTSKPTRYSVIWDENLFSSDEIQTLSYNLCYIFARCTKPVSLVPPVYYADLVAYRGRMFEEVLVEMEASGVRNVSSYDQLLYKVDPNIKDSMFFI